MSKIINPLAEAMFHSDLIASRLTLFLAEVCWAVMLWWPGDTFIRPTYDGMAWLMNESLWAMVFTVSALIQISIVILQSYDTRFGRNFAGFNALLWVYCTASMLMSVYPPPAAIGGEIAITCSALWICFRPIIVECWERKASKGEAIA